LGKRATLAHTRWNSGLGGGWEKSGSLARDRRLGEIRADNLDIARHTKSLASSIRRVRAGDLVIARGARSLTRRVGRLQESGPGGLYDTRGGLTGFECRG